MAQGRGWELAFYRLALGFLAVFAVLPSLLWRVLGGRERIGDLAERLGGGTRPSDPGRPVWLHGASVGELSSARPLIERLLRAPGLRIVVTANTATGRDHVSGWGLSRVSARLAPLDLRWTTRRFLRRWQPSALVQLEKEYWPNRVAMARSAGIPVLQAAAQLSQNSAERFARFPRLAATLLQSFDHVAPQDAPSEARLLALGLPATRIGPRLNLKAGASLAAPDPQQLATLGRLLPRSRTFLAASTHAGEESIVLSAFAQARRRLPQLRLVIAPRHPERGAEVADLIAAAGWAVARRSQGAMPGPAAPVYLADTLGEMGLWYRLAGAAFVGGSLVDRGGHNPYEPARLGCAILHGPHVGNAADAYHLLELHKAAQAVKDASDLAGAIVSVLGDPQQRAAMTARAQRALAQTGNDADAVEAFARTLLGLMGASDKRPIHPTRIVCR